MMNKNITDVRGFSARGGHIGIKSKRRDLALIYSDVPASAAGVYTTNLVMAAPLKLTRRNLANGRAQAIVVTSGNANACTGPDGERAAAMVARTAAEEMGIDETDVVVGATGVIGEPFPVQKAIDGIRRNVKYLAKRYVDGAMAANAIMTTDTFQKEFHVSFTMKGKQVNMAGIAKGAGMIHPNMATMLAFIVSDAAIHPDLLRESLQTAVDRTFNMISVDGDMSTNDMVVILSNGMAGNLCIDRKNQEFRKFSVNLEKVCRYLAMAIVSDGEGATKFVEYRVVNARSEQDARQMVRTVSNSNLVRTALFGRDPNWGRIIAAMGRAGVDMDPERVDIHIGSRKLIHVAHGGAFNHFNKRQLKQMLKSSRIRILMDLNMGDAEATGWGTDFSYEYVRINAEYTT